MREDRLRKDRDEIHNLDDLIRAREEGRSHIAEDRDSLERDIDVPEETDVDEALTFPHPRHKKAEEIELMDTPHEENMGEDWAAQDILPSDYSHYYEEATTADVRDDEDEVVEDQMHAIDHPTLDQVAEEPEVEVMPDRFTPEEGT